MNDSLMERLHKARAGLVCSSPFLATLILRLDAKVDPEAKTQYWVDGKTVGVHPDAARDLPLDELEGLFAQATLNAALGHPMRRAGRDPKRWAQACAQVAQHEVLAAGLRLPQGARPDPQYKGMFAEQAYALMEPPEQDDQDGGGKGQESPQGKPEQGGKGQGKPGKGKPEEGGQEQPGQDGKADTPGKGGKTPSGPPSEPGQDSQPSSSPDPGSGEIRDAQGDPAEIEEQAADWQQAVAQAAQLARAAGNLPGSLDRAAMRVVAPRVSWREATQRYFKNRAKEDHSWLVPNRRFIGASIYLPGMQSERLGTIAIAIDLSGSIRQDDVDSFLSEVSAMRDECHPERIVLLPFDTAVRRVIEIEEDEPLEFREKGGGGTNFRPVVSKLEEMGIEPEVLVYLTDLDCSSFPDEPAYPVLWVSTKRSNAPFGEVIMMLP